MVMVHLVTHSGNQLDDGFGIVVSWRSLSTNCNDSWHEFVSSLALWRVEDGQVPVDDIQDVHELSLVLVDSLYLHVIQGIEWHVEAGVLLDPGL